MQISDKYSRQNIMLISKMRNNFWYTVNLYIFPILQYWTFLYCSSFSYRSSNSANNNGNLLAFAFKSEKERQLSLSQRKSDNYRKRNKGKKQRNKTKNKAKKIKKAITLQGAIEIIG